MKRAYIKLNANTDKPNASSPALRGLLKINITRMNNKMIPLTLFLLLYSFLIKAPLLGQDVRRAYKHLEKADYVKAKEALDKLLPGAPESSSVHFGLMVVRTDTSSPLHDILEAYGHSRIAEKGVNTLTEQDRNIIGEYFTNTEVRRSSWPVNRKIFQAIGAVEAQLIRYIREENNLVLANQVIGRFPDFRYYQNVVHIRNQLEFRRYEKQHTLEGYLEFLTKFPDAAQVPKAIKHRDKLSYDRVVKINTVEAYEQYLKEYPNSVEYHTALKMRNAAAFRLAKQKNSIEAFDDFISRYPSALEIADAKKIQHQLLYEYARKIKTLEAYDAFIRKYPEGSFYIDIFNLKSADLGNRYYRTHGFDLGPVSVIRTFDNKNHNESAGGIAATPDGHFIVACNTQQTDSLYRDAWLLKLDADGKMLWNVITGNNYHDSVVSVAVNGQGDVIAVGYTWLGPDSTSREAWVMQLDRNGKKGWNRTISNWQVTSTAITPENHIVLGGYIQHDSVSNRYNILVINNSGRRLWGRTYLSPGEINGLVVDSEGGIVVAGSRWLVKLSDKGYMIWDKVLEATDSITAVSLMPDGGYLFGGKRQNGKHLFIRTTHNGVVTYTRELDNPYSFTVNRMTMQQGERIAVMASGEFGSVVYTLDANATLVSQVQIPVGAALNILGVSSDGQLMYQFHGDGNVTFIK